MDDESVTIGGGVASEGAEDGIVDNVDSGAPLQGSGNPPATFTFYATIPVGAFRENLLGLQEEGFIDAGARHSAYLLKGNSVRHLRPYLEIAKECPTEAGPSLLHVRDMVNFDRVLSAELLKGVGMLESRLRASYSFMVEDRLGKFAIYDEANFLRWDRYFKSLSSYQREVDTRARKDRRLKEELAENGGKLPISEGVERMSLGTLANFYGNTADSGVSRSVAEDFNCSKSELVNWLKTTIAARNMIAHFEPFIVRKQLPSIPVGIRSVDSDKSRPFYFALLLMRMLAGDPNYGTFSVDSALRFRAGIDDALAPFCEAYGETARHMGIPENWIDLLNAAGNSSAAASRERMRPISDRTITGIMD